MKYCLLFLLFCLSGCFNTLEPSVIQHEEESLAYKLLSASENSSSYIRVDGIEKYFFVGKTYDSALGVSCRRVTDLENDSIFLICKESTKSDNWIIIPSNS